MSVRAGVESDAVWKTNHGDRGALGLLVGLGAFLVWELEAALCLWPLRPGEDLGGPYLIAVCEILRSVGWGGGCGSLSLILQSR